MKVTHLFALIGLGTFSLIHAPSDVFAAAPLPSWNAGPAKQALVDFVAKTTKEGSPDFVPVAERIATFDQDGTLWVEHPIYSQVMYCLERVPALVKEKPELAHVAPFFSIVSGVQCHLGGRELSQLLCEPPSAEPGAQQKA